MLRKFSLFIRGHKSYGLFELFDKLCAQYLGVRRKFFVEVLENRCTVEEAGKIIMPILCSDEGDPEDSRTLFYSKLTKKELKNVKLPTVISDQLAAKLNGNKIEFIG